MVCLLGDSVGENWLWMRLRGIVLSCEDIDAVAVRVVELLSELDAQKWPSAQRAAACLMDAATVARLLGVSRGTVYAKADELGAIRIGSGPRARLRFDPARIVSTAPAPPGPDKPLRRRGTRGWRYQREDGDLLPVRGGRNGSRRPLGS
jgi:hypothetical protein